MIRSRLRMFPLLGFLTASALFALPPDAASQDVRLSARIECKNWADARNKGVGANFEHYLQGFLDGLSLGAKLDFWGTSEANRLTPAEAFLWMDRYCKASPAGNTLEGMHVLFTERRQALAAPQKPAEKKKP